MTVSNITPNNAQQVRAQRRSERLTKANALAKWYQEWLGLPRNICQSMAMQQARRSPEMQGEQGNDYMLAYLTYKAKKYEGEPITRLCHILGPKDLTFSHLRVYDLDREAERTPITANVLKVEFVKLKHIVNLTRKNEYIENLVYGEYERVHCMDDRYPDGF